MICVCLWLFPFCPVFVVVNEHLKSVLLLYDQQPVALSKPSYQTNTHPVKKSDCLRAKKNEMGSRDTRSKESLNVTVCLC